MTNHDPATEHVKTYNPLAWTKAKHAAAMMFWGPEYHERDPEPLMKAVSAALYEIAPAIVQQERERVAAQGEGS